MNRFNDDKRRAVVFRRAFPGLLVPGFLGLFLLFMSAACERRVALHTSVEPVPPLTLLTTTIDYDPPRHHAAHQVAAWWRKLGLEVRVIALDFNELTEAIRDRNLDDRGWHAFMYGWTGRVERGDPDMFIYTINHSSQAGGQGNNYPEYINPAFDALAEAQRRIADPEIRRTVVHAAQEMLAEDVPFVALYYRHVLHAYRQDKWNNMTAMAGEGLYHEWLPFHALPLDENEQRLVVAGTQEPGSLNPMTAATVWEWKLLRLIYDKLARVNQLFRPEPWAAEQITHVDETLIEVVLRPGMTFHDGMPVRPEDVKFSFEHMITSGTPYFKSFLDPIESITVTDEGVIQFRLRHPYAPFVALTLAQIPILPEHLWGERAATAGDEVPVIGSGPFVFEEWIPGETIRLATSPTHFQADQVRMSGLDYRVFPDAASILQGLIRGEVCMTGALLEPELVPAIKASAALELVQVPDIGFHFLGFNCHAPPFNDRVVRQAAYRAMNLDMLVEELLHGHGDPGGPGQSISTGNPFWKNQQLEFGSFDPAEARRLLAEAGYTWDKAGQLLYPRGK